MKPLKILQPSNLLSRMKPWHKTIAKRALISFGVVTVIALAIWFLTPSLIIHGKAAFAPAQKRLYVIAAFYLLWLLKLLILDFDAPKPAEPVDATTQKALDHLLHRFQGALSFLQKTTITRYGKPTHLMHLPWYLLIGPEDAGKTALLAHANINYILQRQFNPEKLESSDYCDWWITRDACLIDVPGKYAHSQSGLHQKLWSYFLGLVKQAELQEQISGIILALPLPELMNKTNPHELNALIHSLKKRFERVQAAFERPIPCVLVITKCDLLPGFNEYFSESADDEVTQAWGITLPYLKAGEKIEASFTTRFNALIKKLNQQLIWRLHQERNPLTRPHIKDFPLQIERLKHFTLDVIKKLAQSHQSFQLHAIYLTSAMQPETPATPTVIIDNDHETQHAIQRFKAPNTPSRAYFVKQLLTYGLSIPTDTPAKRAAISARWQRRLAYAASALLVLATTFQLGHDFERGLKRTQNIQEHITTYQNTLSAFHNPNDGMIKTVDLLNGLQASVKPETLSLSVKSLLTFYTHQSDQKAALIYRQALQSILLPEVSSYLAEALKNPVNADTAQLYRVLKAYLMLGDAAHFNASYVKETIDMLAAKQLPATTMQPLRFHLSLALSDNWQPITLDQNIIQPVQHYLNAMSNDQLAYLIIRNQTDNTHDVALGTDPDSLNIFSAQKTLAPISGIFTAQGFTSIMQQALQDASMAVTQGNWVIGARNTPQTMSDTLTQALRTAYLNDYINAWDAQISNLRLNPAKDLNQVNAILMALTATHSPFTDILQTVHDNTYFDPIASNSPHLYALGALMDKPTANAPNAVQIIAALQALQTYIQPVMTAQSPRKAAYDIIAARMQHTDNNDAITQLRLLADKSPEPVKSWLNQVSNDTWRLLSKTEMNYMDTSWQENVVRPYQSTIADHYPFNHESRREVPLNQFTQFFGNPGTITQYYNQFLKPFVDTSSAEWRWKKIDDLKLPFSDESLRDIQQAIRIHHAFFPKGDKQLLVQFNLSPYQLGKDIKRVNLNINNLQIADGQNKLKAPHVMSWPGRYDYRMSSLDVTLKNDQMIHSDFPGTWGWLKLISQSYESPISQKQILVNFSQNKTPVKYVLSTDGEFNPLITVNLYNFKLPNRLIDTPTA